MNSKFFTLFFLLAIHASYILAHSWVACTDYRILSDDDGKTFNPANCYAYARNWKDGHATTVFGLDTGYDYRPNNAPLCKYPLSGPISNYYSDQYPMAQYTPGQRVCLAWPPKNHVTATCVNPYIPDNGLKIFVSSPNPTSDPADASGMRLVKDFGKNTQADQFIGFQHCPLFCQDNDKALCTNCFDVPSDLQVGSTYTFVWEWAFNSLTDLYSSCWEAQIVGNNNAPSTTQSNNNAPSTTRSQAQTTAKNCQTTKSQQQTQTTRAQTTQQRTTEAVPSTTRAQTTQQRTTEDNNSESTTAQDQIDSTTAQDESQDSTTSQDDNNSESTTSQATTDSGIINVNNNTNPINQEQQPCNTNKDCSSGVCEISGFCSPKKQFFTTPIIIAIALGGTLFVVITVSIILIIFRYRLRKIPYVH